MTKHLIPLLIATLATTAGVASADHPMTSSGRGYLGIAAIPISTDLRRHFGAPSDRGVLVDQVRADSPAARAGLEDGDVLVEVAGKPVHSATEILGVLAGHKQGDRIELAVIRANQPSKLEARLDADVDDDVATTSSTGPMPFEFEHVFDTQKLENRIDQLEKRLDQLEKK